jgi:predicted patatin/cPLA2 family phospholipase
MRTDHGYAVGDTDVMSVLLARHSTGSQPGSRSDGHRVALVVEGGGMRGVYTAGMVRALAGLGLRDSIDEIVAVSAGALAGAALVMRQTARLPAVYHEDLCDRAFIDVRRALAPSGAVVSLDFLFDTVLRSRHGFDATALVDADIPLKPVATSLDHLRSRSLDGMTTAEEWGLALRASACIPLWAGPPIELHGRRLVDGYVSDPLPVGRAIDGGATHVLVLLAWVATERPSPAGRVSPLVRARLDRLAPGLAALMSRRGHRHAESMRLVTGHRRRHGAKVLGLRPWRHGDIRALTADPHRLRLGGEAGEAAVHRAVMLTRGIRGTH